VRSTPRRASPDPTPMRLMIAMAVMSMTTAAQMNTLGYFKTLTIVCLSVLEILEEDPAHLLDAQR